jgi:hypothetical protein
MTIKINGGIKFKKKNLENESAPCCKQLSTFIFRNSEVRFRFGRRGLDSSGSG